MKYPKTPHLPFSPGVTRDDKIIKDMSVLKASNVVITEKLDGENTCMEHDKMHARSEGSSNHDSRDMVKGIHAAIRHMIPERFAIFGENLYAKHSIEYPKLTAVFYVFAVFDKQTQQFLSWAETLHACTQLNLAPVPVIATGKYVEIQLPKESSFGSEIEGYVIRSAEAIPLDSFDKMVAKYVRADHVQTDEHWKRNWIPNPPWRRIK